MRAARLSCVVVMLLAGGASAQDWVQFVSTQDGFKASFTRTPITVCASIQCHPLVEGAGAREPVVRRRARVAVNLRQVPVGRPALT